MQWLYIKPLQLKTQVQIVCSFAAAETKKVIKRVFASVQLLSAQRNFSVASTDAFTLLHELG